ncbi:RNA polymerase sigma factor [Methylotuvimicrobium buryatense]|uniref:RNA polymerase sigma factor n=1 Tax=Methylotuvimicrobium buryatense TaxID=95641 RepID=A0A4P9UJ05_METBY|nr:RNA polymerase sigma factor [Methylotuvimicrobium buryatense]QCW81142.1 RNA polymerase sigma factor [Methylotuvimicrobium buryatense]
MLEFTPSEAQALIERHREELHRFLVRRIACADTANDLLQDIFLRLINLHSAEPIGNPRAFAYRIAANLAIDHLRKQRETDDIDADEYTQLPDDTAGPERIVFGRQQLELCEQALEELSPLCLKIFTMSRFEGYSHKQIAEELNISVSWVEKNIILALKQCKKALSDA